MGMKNLKTNPRRWQPPHCPNPDCEFHHSPTGWRWLRMGTYTRATAPFIVQRFRCCACRRSFSSQTFRSTYWLRRPNLQHKIFLLTVNGMANSQIARALGCAPSTVDNQLSRLGRLCLLFHRHLPLQTSPAVDIVADGLVSFEYSQHFPFEHLIAVETDTSFIRHFTDAPLRRSGRMTDRQKKRRAELEAALGKPDPKAVEKAMREVFEVSLEGAEKAIVRTDKHKAYPRALRRVECEIEHRTTDSRSHRDRHNEMFEINSLDRFLRHSSANHTRETLAYSKRRQRASERLAIFTVWKNCIKLRWERGTHSTAAMLKGLLDRRLKVGDVLRKRLFPSHIPLPPRWREYYQGLVTTPVLGKNRRHMLKYAY